MCLLRLLCSNSPESRLTVHCSGGLFAGLSSGRSAHGFFMWIFKAERDIGCWGTCKPSYPSAETLLQRFDASDCESKSRIYFALGNHGLTSSEHITGKSLANAPELHQQPQTRLTLNTALSERAQLGQKCTSNATIDVRTNLFALHNHLLSLKLLLFSRLRVN